MKAIAVFIPTHDNRMVSMSCWWFSYFDLVTYQVNSTWIPIIQVRVWQLEYRDGVFCVFRADLYVLCIELSTLPTDARFLPLM